MEKNYKKNFYISSDKKRQSETISSSQKLSKLGLVFLCEWLVSFYSLRHNFTFAWTEPLAGHSHIGLMKTVMDMEAAHGRVGVVVGSAEEDWARERAIPAVSAEHKRKSISFKGTKTSQTFQTMLVASQQQHWFRGDIES